MNKPPDLPDTPIDLREYAPRLAKTKGLAEELKDSLDVSFRAIVGVKRDGNERKRVERLRQVIDDGVEVAQRLAEEPTAQPSDKEMFALEAVVRLYERPALLVQRNNFPQPPSRWRQLDNPYRSDIRKRLPSAGRVETVRRGARTTVGTGFVCGEELLMTNEHVVEQFADRSPDGVWQFAAGQSPRVDFRAEHDLPDRLVFEITEVVGVHPEKDLALLRMARQASEPAGVAPPVPMQIRSDAPDSDKDLDLYVIGYPWTDNEGVTPSELMEELFDGHYQVKRLQPGEFRALFQKEGVFSHDCSTLGGNSGSCVVDLDTDRVVGLHYGGKFGHVNYAVALWKLRSDPLFAGRGLNFD